MATNAVGKAEQAGDSAPLEVLARVELIAYGAVHLLVGWPHPSGGMRRPHSAATPAGTRIGACDPPVDPTVTLAYQDRDAQPSSSWTTTSSRSLTSPGRSWTPVCGRSCGHGSAAFEPCAGRAGRDGHLVELPVLETRYRRAHGSWVAATRQSEWRRSRDRSGNPCAVRQVVLPLGCRVVALGGGGGMPHPAGQAQPQQFLCPAIPEACPPGEGMVWLGRGAFADVAAVAGTRSGG